MTTPRAVQLPDRVPSAIRQLARRIARLNLTPDETAYVLALLAADVTDALRHTAEGRPAPTALNLLDTARDRIERLRNQRHADSGIHPDQQTLI